MEATVPSSPTWFQSQVVDSSWDNRIAYGSFSSLVIIKPSDFFHPITLTNVHADKVLSVSFAPKGAGNRLLSTCSKGQVIVWNLDTCKALLINSKHKNFFTYGNWSHADKNLIVCADDNGGVSWWNIESNSLCYTNFIGHTFTVISCCPHKSDIIAAGTKQGAVCIINLQGKGSILHKLQGHNVEIVSLAWCPVPVNIFRNVENEFVLASSARERHIYFWRASKDGLCEARVELPCSGTKAPANNFAQWSCLSWPSPFLFLASTIAGEVHSLRLDDVSRARVAGQLVGRAANRDLKMKWQPFFGKHMRGPVTVNCRPWISSGNSSECDWRSGNTEDLETLVWTSGSDRLIHGIHLGSAKMEVKLHTFGGAVHALAISPIDGHSLAIGAADKTIRLVNLSDSNVHNMKSFPIKQTGKVMALSWHPTKDGWLAYGTSDGYVGIQFTQSKKLRLSFKLYSNDSIYVVQWGPSLSLSFGQDGGDNGSSEVEDVDETSVFALYSVGGGRVAILNPDQPDSQPIDPLKDILPLNSDTELAAPKITDLSWKPDYTLLAIGNERGLIHLFYLTSKRVLRFVFTVAVHNKLIQDLAWHPECTEVVENSLYCNWLAAASNKLKICVVDVSSVLNAALSWETDGKTPDIKVPCVATLSGHKMRVAKVSWNPHQPGQLLSASYDQCAQVWDVTNQVSLSCFVDHGNPIFTCIWSPTSSDLAITGGMDSTLRIWSVKNQNHKVPIEKKTDSRQYLKDALEADSVTSVEMRVDGSSAGVSDGVCSKCRKRKEKAVLPLSGTTINDDSLNSSILKYLLDLSDDNECPPANVDSTGCLPLHSGLFGDNDRMAKLVSAEYEANCANAAWDSAFVIDVWRGRVNEGIAEAIKSKRLTDFHVSMAAMVSHKTWIETCSAYAKQLQECREFSKASAFLLAIHKLPEAVELLAENGKFRQAIVLARSRLLLPPDDPMIKKLLIRWAEYSKLQGNLSIASVCHAAAGQWDEAAQLMSRHRNPTRLLLAAQVIALKTKDKVTGLLYARECFNAGLQKGDWSICKSVFQTYQDLCHLKLLVDVHHSIDTSLSSSITVDEWLNCKLKRHFPDTNGKAGVDLKTPKTNSAEIVEKEVVFVTPEFISSLKEDLSYLDTSTKVWIAVSSKVTLAFALAPTLFSSIELSTHYKSSVSEDESLRREAVRYIVQAMALLYHHDVMTPKTGDTVSALIKFCMWLFEGGALEDYELLSTPSQPLQSSVRSYLAAALMFWLDSKGSLDPEVCDKALQIIELLKNDVFSVRCLKWFKVDLQHRLLKECKIRENSVQIKALPNVSSKDSLESGEACIVRDVPSEGNAVIAADSEYDKLTSWLKDFQEEREKVPNPYLCFSSLTSFLTNTLSNVDKAQADTLLSQYRDFWESINSQLDHL